MEDILLVHRKSNKKFPDSLTNVLMWQTCLRKILFVTETEFHHYQDFLELGDEVLRDEDALSFLMEILCGLHSPIIGETEVLGQFKNFVETRKKVNDPLFADHQKWLQFLFTEVKKARSEYLVGLGSYSYGSLLRRYTKNMDAVTICGSGQLAQEILPWLAHKNYVQTLCRDSAKLQRFADKYNHLQIQNYDDAVIQGEALVIAATLSDDRILELIAEKPDLKIIFDLRGEENNLARLSAIPVISLQQFFSELEETKKDTAGKIINIKEVLLEKAQGYFQRTDMRPLGWDDLCS